MATTAGFITNQFFNPWRHVDQRVIDFVVVRIFSLEQSRHLLKLGIGDGLSRLLELVCVFGSKRDQLVDQFTAVDLKEAQFQHLCEPIS